MNARELADQMTLLAEQYPEARVVLGETCGTLRQRFDVFAETYGGETLVTLQAYSEERSRIADDPPA